LTSSRCRGRPPAWAVAAVLASLAAPAAAAQDTTARPVIGGEILSTRKTRITGYPYAYYTPETELAFGVGGIATFYTDTAALLRPSKVTLSAYYSTKQQYKITLRPQLYLARNRIFLSANLDYGYYVDKFWGIGSETPDIDDENYESEGWGVELNAQFPLVFKLIDNTKFGGVYDFLSSDIVDTRGNPNLVTGGVTGSEGGTSSGLGFIWVWDNRNHIFYPNRGGFHQVKAIFYAASLGSDFRYNRFEVDLRQYVSLKQDRVWAFQLFASMATGSAPFYDLPALGGPKIMRGYYQGRYRDALYLAGQVEYRTPVWRRFGLVGFAGIGDVAPEFRDLRLRDFKTSLGFGLRFLFNRAEKVNIRADFGFGRGTTGVYFNLEEAF